MSGTPVDKEKALSLYESERRRKPAKKFRKSHFYILPEEVGEGASKKSKAVYGEKNGSPKYSRRSTEGNSQHKKYVSHSPEYDTSRKKNVT